jgi:transcriptional regulator with GAF, ATPase, and Fis domain
MFESEFFGHTRGAFTGAIKDRGGRFELANGGTIFLDEVGDLPMELQPKLLRVLQDGQYERLGDERTRQTDVRIIAATNHDLESRVRTGLFRQDLFYRLSVFPIELPPLRARRDDIPRLAMHFVKVCAERLGVAAPPVPIDVIERWKHYSWPGNVRELQNVIERAVILARGGPLRVPPDLAFGRTRMAPDVSPDDAEVIVPDQEWRHRERTNMLAALKRTKGRISGVGGAAALLGVKPSTLSSRLKSLGIQAEDAH